MAVKQKVVLIDTLQAQTSVKDLRNQLKQLKDTMLSTEQGTEEYNQAMRQAANIMHTLKEQTEEMNASAMDFGQIASNSVKALGGMVAGLLAAKATMNLFGIENEAVLESLQKMQSLMAITQALPSIDNGIKAFKRLGLVIKGATAGMNGFKKALLTSGIGALVVVLGAIIANFDKISAWLDEITGQTDFLGELSDKVVGGLYAGWAGLIQTLKAVGTAIINYVTAPFKAIVNAIQAYTSTEGGFGDKLKAAAKAMKNGVVQQFNDTKSEFQKIGAASAEAYQKGYDSNKQRRAEKNKEEAIEEGKTEGKAKGEAKADAEQEAYWKKRLKQINKEERADMLALQAMGLNYEEYVKQKEALEDKFTKKRIAEIKAILAGMKEEEEGYVELQEQLIDLQDRLVKKPESEKSDSGNGESSNPEVNQAQAINEALNTTKQALQEVADNPAWANIIGNIQLIVNVFDDLNKNHIEKGSREAMNAYMQIAALGFGAVGQMLNGLAAEQDQSNKKGFETAKKMQIASATMTTLSSILQALAAGNSMASQMGLAAPVGWALGAAMATMVGALGAVNIAKISKTKFGGSSNVSGSASTPSMAAVNTVQAPVQYTQDVQGAAIEDSIKDTRVYVTEGDISSTQKKVDVAESEAEY